MTCVTYGDARKVSPVGFFRMICVTYGDAREISPVGFFPSLTHPGAKLERPAAGAAAELANNGELGTNGSEPEVDASAKALAPAMNEQDAATVAPKAPEDAAEALFAALDAEAEEEATGGP